MARFKITSKGQVTIPIEVRELLGLRPGDEVEFVEEHGTVRLRRRVAASPFEKYRGYLKEFVGQNTDELIEELRGR